MTRIINHVVENTKLYFVFGLVICLMLGSQIIFPSFNSSSDSIGLQDDEYMDNIEYVDSIFNPGKQILLEVIPLDGSFWEIYNDMALLEEELKSEFDTINIRSWISSLPYLHSRSFLKNKERSQFFARYKKMDLFSNLVGVDLKSFLIVLDIPKNSTVLSLSRFDRALENANFKQNYKFNATSVFHIENSINKSVVKDILS